MREEKDPMARSQERQAWSMMMAAMVMVCGNDEKDGTGFTAMAGAGWIAALAFSKSNPLSIPQNIEIRWMTPKMTTLCKVIHADLRGRKTIVILPKDTGTALAPHDLL
jgi:hypothetical protein